MSLHLANPSVRVTNTENVFARALTAANIIYKRQYKLSPTGYVADFFLPSHNLVIEIDGSYHNSSPQKDYDSVRTTVLHRHGYNLIRYSNKAVTRSTVGVILNLKSFLKTLDKD